MHGEKMARRDDRLHHGAGEIEELGAVEHGEHSGQSLRFVRCLDHGEEILVACLCAAYSSDA